MHRRKVLAAAGHLLAGGLVWPAGAERLRAAPAEGAPSAGGERSDQFPAGRFKRVVQLRRPLGFSLIDATSAGSLIAALGSGAVFVVQAKTGNLLRRLPDDRHDADTARISRDGKWVALGYRPWPVLIENLMGGPEVRYEGGAVKVFSTPDRNETTTLLAHEFPVGGICLCSSTDDVISIDWSCELRRWSRKRGRLVGVVRDHQSRPPWHGRRWGADPALQVPFSERPLRVLCIRMGSILYWDLTHKVSGEIVRDQNGLHSVDLSRNGWLVAAGYYDHKICVWHFETGRKLMETKLPREFWPPQQLPSQPTAGPPFFPARVTKFSHDARRIITAGDRGGVYLWDTSTGRLLEAHPEVQGPIRGVVPLSAGLRIISGGEARGVNDEPPITIEDLEFRRGP